MVKIYWNANPASMTVNKPNIQVNPSRGERMTHALRPFLKQTSKDITKQVSIEVVLAWSLAPGKTREG